MSGFQTFKKINQQTKKYTVLGTTFTINLKPDTVFYILHFQASQIMLDRDDLNKVSTWGLHECLKFVFNIDLLPKLLVFKTWVSNAILQLWLAFWSRKRCLFDETSKFKEHGKPCITIEHTAVTKGRITFRRCCSHSKENINRWKRKTAARMYKKVPVKICWPTTRFLFQNWEASSKHSGRESYAKRREIEGPTQERHKSSSLQKNSYKSCYGFWMLKQNILPAPE